MTRNEITRRFPNASRAFVDANCNEDNSDTQISATEPECDKASALVGSIPSTASSVDRIRVCFTQYRVRPLDADNAAASCKDLLDGLQSAALIADDSERTIEFECKQVKVRHQCDQQTVITIEYPE